MKLSYGLLFFLVLSLGSCLKLQKDGFEASLGRKIGPLDYLVNYRQIKIDAMVRDNERPRPTKP